MNFHNLSSTLLSKNVFQGTNPQNTSANSQSVDCLGYEIAEVQISGAPATSGQSVTYQVQAAPDNATWTNITGASQTITQAMAAAAASGAAQALIDVKLSIENRYLRVVLTGSATVTGTSNVNIQLAKPRYAPVTQDNTPVLV